MSVKLSSHYDTIERTVTLEGLADIMFDRYAGDNTTRLEVWQKFYFEAPGSRVIGLPAINLMSFLSAHNTTSAPKRLRDKRKYKDICNACLSFVTIKPTFIPLLRLKHVDTKDSEKGMETELIPITFGRFEGESDLESGAYISRAVARLEKGIPNPKERPVIPVPWILQFKLSMISNREISEQELANLFDEGGRVLGLGTWRGLYGKFRVAGWE